MQESPLRLKDHGKKGGKIYQTILWDSLNKACVIYTCMHPDMYKYVWINAYICTDAYILI